MIIILYKTQYILQADLSSACNDIGNRKIVHILFLFWLFPAPSNAKSASDILWITMAYISMCVCVLLHTKCRIYEGRKNRR